jgi:hypothetical protein
LRLAVAWGVQKTELLPILELALEPNEEAKELLKDYVEKSRSRRKWYLNVMSCSFFVVSTR